jgi:hypothetical protein
MPTTTSAASDHTTSAATSTPRDRVIISRVRPDVHRAAAQLAKRRGESMSQLVQDMLEAAGCPGRRP